MICLSSIIYAETFSDPTRPADWKDPTIAAKTNSNEKIATHIILPKVVDAIIISAKHRVTIIQGSVMAEGEVIEGYTVKKINAYNVVLANAVHTVTLPLISTNVSTIIQYEQ